MVKVAAMRRSRKQRSNNSCAGKWTKKLGTEVKWFVIDLQLMVDVHLIFKTEDESHLGPCIRGAS